MLLTVGYGAIELFRRAARLTFLPGQSTEG
jgi:hypothetical protein